MINIKKIDVDVANQGHITNSYIVYDDNINCFLEKFQVFLTP